MKKAKKQTESDRQALKELQKIPNVGPATAGDLVRLGIRSLDDLKTQDPLQMYRRLGRLDGQLHDPCVLDVFMAIVDYANGAPAKPWWKYTPIRKTGGRLK